MPSRVLPLTFLAVISALACNDAAAPPPSVLTITFARDGELYSTDTFGTTPAPLMPLGESGYEPSWSPDGRYVAFTRALPSDYQIVVLHKECYRDSTHRWSARQLLSTLVP